MPLPMGISVARGNVKEVTHFQTPGYLYSQIPGIGFTQAHSMLLVLQRTLIDVKDESAGE